MATARKFSKQILKHLEIKHPSSAFEPTFVNNNWRQPKFSLRRQADLRKACLLNHTDTDAIGMPPTKVSNKRPLYGKPPKGHKHQLGYEERQERIRKNMEEMPEKIRKWKQELAKEKEKNKSSLPF